MIRQRLPSHHQATLRDADPVDALVFTYGAAQACGDAAEQRDIRDRLQAIARTKEADELADWMTDPFDILITVAADELARRAAAAEDACSR